VTGWLLDTNVISEWRKAKPDRRVVEFLSSEPRSSLFNQHRLSCRNQARRRGRAASLHPEGAGQLA
jgi:predicted nucleic acid-binding protein